MADLPREERRDARTYYEGMEDQLSALGLVLNCTVLWHTFYTNRALEQLRAQG
ncbi:Tn3 family transposase [Nocardia grenadensis]|uniref:Tn3 family transposase n=1 Tax=Nocardia grenadensis TaxID=931537 RepID=UPI000A727761|nr:Tn3 family transposase [Nocardia grenadensis]